MGFFGVLRSLEDLLYEVMTWLVFYPRTLWKVLRHPQQMIDYSDEEQGDSPEEQYTDMLSPPLFLILTILIAHGLEMQMGQAVQKPGGALGKLFGNSEELVLLYRSMVFSIYPLMFAVALLKRSDLDLDRQTLRRPFFSQCYLGALFALLISVSTIMVRAKAFQVEMAGLILFAVTTVWYLAIQARWLVSHLQITSLRAGLVTVGTFLKATIVVSFVSSLFAL